MIIDKPTILQLFGCLMKHPQYLSESDKYNLTPDDFGIRLDKFLFIAIDNLYRNGATRIQPIDVENYLSTNETAKVLFTQQNGIELLQDADYLSDEHNFAYYYKKIKKFNLLNAFENRGIDIHEFYCENAIDSKSIEINKKFEQLEINEMLDAIKRKVLGIEREFIQGDTTEVVNICEGIEEILQDAENQNDVGLPLQGEIFNEVCGGARKGIFVLRSASSGTGKTRQAVGDACYLAFPIRYNPDNTKWERTGSNKKVLVIATEQTAKEIQKMVLAYLTGFNETKFRYGEFTTQERIIIKQALYILEKFKDNLFIVRMPNPTIELVKNIVRENVLLHDIEYVFYDYIFISPSLLSEFKGYSLRNDEILLMFSTALKDLAVELNIFLMSSTQVNSNADNNQNIRNEGSIAGSRSIINKADIGVMCARPTREELDFFKNDNESMTFNPNLVTDIYKVRSGEWNQVRIWSDIDLGNLRKKDLFVTDARLEVIKFNMNYRYELSLGAEEQNIISILKEVEQIRD